MTRTYARAPRGQRAVVTEPFQQGPHFSVLSARGVDGLCAPFLIAGASNSEIFTRSVEQFLVPCLRPGQQVWLDHVKFHSDPKAVAAIAATGARVCYLPTYSPDFNPMEHGIAKIKEHLRAAKARTPRTLTTALAQALNTVTTSDIHGWFTHCGYVFPLE
jgi:transposase